MDKKLAGFTMLASTITIAGVAISALFGGTKMSWGGLLLNTVLTR